MNQRGWSGLVLVCAALVACSGSSETSSTGTGGNAGAGGQAGTGGQAANAGQAGTSGADASVDAPDDTGRDGPVEAPVPDAINPDAQPWDECFVNQGASVSSSLKICKDGSVITPCTIQEHQIDCCGSVRYVGVTETDVATFEACEQAWRAQLPVCDCPSHLPVVEQPSDGEVAGIDDVTVDCINCTMQTCICMTVPK